MNKKQIGLLGNFTEQLKGYKGLEIRVLDRQEVLKDIHIEMSFRRLSQRPSLKRLKQKTEQPLEVRIKEFRKVVYISESVFNSPLLNSFLDSSLGKVKKELDKYYKKWGSRIIGNGIPDINQRPPLMTQNQ